MNLRIHKKLSKRAAPLLPLLGDNRQQYQADKGGCYFGNGHLYKCDFKHFDRDKARHPFGNDRKYRPKHDRHWIVLRRPDNTLKGTIMVGCMSGYYEPEWEEETAWESLCRLVEDYFTEWPEEAIDAGNWPSLTRDLGSPTKILKAAMDIVRDKGCIP